MTNKSKIDVNDEVKHSTLFLRSVGHGHPFAECRGLVLELIDGWLAVVEWHKPGIVRPAGCSRINVANLVKLGDVAWETRKVEHTDNVPGLVIGSNAFLRPKI